MPYVDAMFDRDQDIIRAVERKDGKRHFHEYQAKYTFYYKDPKGKYKSVYGDPLSRIVSGAMAGDAAFARQVKRRHLAG